jgi:hypothetical protein
VEGGAKNFGVFRVKNHDFTPKKKFNALSVDGRVLCYGGWTKEGKKYMGGGNLTI